MINQTCRICQGQLQQQRVTRMQRYQGRWIAIENLPALVCQQCGEQYYAPDVHDLVVTLISGQDAPIRTETIDVYDATSVA